MFRIRENAAALAAALLIAAPLFAHEERYQTTFERDVPYRGGVVTIDHNFGGVKIETAAGSNVSVKATVRASDPAFGQQIRIEAVPAGNGVDIRTTYPSHTAKGDFSYSVDLRVTVPPAAVIRAQNRFGSINAEGIAGGSELMNTHGSISLSNGRGPQKLENQFGSIKVENIAGDATISNSHGSIKADGIRGVATVKNRFGSISLSGVERNAVVENANGSVSVEDVRGSADVTNGFGSLSVENVGGSVEANGNHSRLTVKGVRGDATVQTSFGSVVVSDVRGAVVISNNNGSVKASEIGRDVKVRNSFATVSVEKVHGGVDVENQNGSITVADLPTAPCRPVILRTSHATIKVEVSPEASYAVNARTSHGSIKSDVPIATRSAGDDAVVGTIGGGKCRLELANTNGNIRIEKQ